jgi:hypothetical protein
MAIDPRIILASQHVQMPDLLGMAGQAENLKASRRQNKLAELAFADREAAQQQDRTMADLYRGAVNPDGTINRAKLTTGAAQAGMGARIPAMQKGFAEQDETQFKAQKAQREAEKEQFEVAFKQIGLMGQVIGSARDQASYDQGVMALQRAGVDVSSIPPQYDPAYVEQSRQQVLTAAQQLEQAWKAKEFHLDVQKFGETKRHNVATEQTTRDNAAATREVASATRDAATVQRDRDTEMKLSDDYRTQSKSFKEVSDAYRQISGTLDKATESPAATLAAATKFMKLLDPGSVVRESELGMALQASGVLDRASNYFEVLKRGKVLTKQQAADFKAITAQIYQAAQDGQLAIDADYSSRAKRYGLRPENIVQDLGQGASAKGGKGRDIYADADAILGGK